MENYREFGRSFLKICSRVGLYGINHPATAATICLFHADLKALAGAGDISISSADGKVLLNGVVIEEKGPLHGLFDRLGALSVTFKRGVGPDELSVFLAAVTQTPVDTKFLKEGTANIRINAVHYVRTSEEAARENGGEVFSGGELEGMGLEQMIRRFIERTVKSEEDRKKVFEAVMSRFAFELEEKVKEATVRLESEKADLVSDREKTEGLLSGAVLSTITIDDEGRVLMLDPDAEKVVSAKLKDKAGLPIWDGLREGQMCTVAKKTGEAFTVNDIMVKGEDETKRVIRASNALIRNTEGRMVGLFSVLSDITKYKELDKMKKDFVANVTHELRTPLVATKQALSNLLSVPEGLSDGHKSMIGIALRNTERLYRLVNDILDFSRLDAGKLKLNREVIETSLLLKEIIASIAPFAERKGVSLDLAASGALPRLWADRDRVTQVFVNLLSNALKFTDKGGTVTVSVTGVRKDGADVFLEVAVRDTGCGIDPENAGKIFEKFVTGEHKNAGIKGTGLGLTITKAIVEMHGGGIRVESRPGKGSAFYATIPIVPEDSRFLGDGARLAG